MKTHAETIGKLIFILRTEKGISQTELAEGLCTVPMLSRIESGQTIPEVFLVDRLLQRLGKSPDKFETILFDNEYEEMENQAFIENEVELGKYDEVNIALEEYICKFGEKGTIRHQYYYQIKAVLEFENANYQKCVEHLLNSIECTLPNFWVSFRKSVLLSVSEIELMIMLSEAYFCIGNDKKAKELLESLLTYMENHYSDEMELVKVYPKAVYLQTINTKNEKNIISSLKRCERACSMLVESGTIVFLSEIMRSLIEMYSDMNLTEKRKRLEKQLESLETIYKDAQEVLYMSELKLRWFKEAQKREFQLFSDLIMGERKARGISREQLIAGIYENPETLARIESGKQNPNYNKYALIMEKLGLNKEKYVGHLDTEYYEILQLRKKINILISRREYEEAKIELEQLRQIVDCNTTSNMQFFMEKDAWIDYGLNVIDSSELYDRATEALKLTFFSADANYMRVPMKAEADILNQLAVSLWKKGDIKKGMKLLKELEVCYENGRMRDKYYCRSLSVLLRNYMLLQEIDGSLDEAKRLFDKIMELEFSTCRAETFDFCLSELACIYDKMDMDREKKEKAVEKYLRHAFYIGDLFKRKANNKKLDIYYRQRFDKEVEWY